MRSEPPAGEMCKELNKKAVATLPPQPLQLPVLPLNAGGFMLPLPPLGSGHPKRVCEGGGSLPVFL